MPASIAVSKYEHFNSSINTQRFGFFFHNGMVEPFSEISMPMQEQFGSRFGQDNWANAKGVILLSSKNTPKQIIHRELLPFLNVLPCISDDLIGGVEFAFES